MLEMKLLSLFLLSWHIIIFVLVVLAAIQKYHILGGLNKFVIVCHSSRGWKVQDQGTVGRLVSGEGLFPGS